MHPLTDKQLRAAFVNASRKEVADLLLPADFAILDWDSLDYLGWRNPKSPKRAYLLVPGGDGEPVGILLQRADARPAARAQCQWCADVQLPNDVVFYSARRAGAAGRNGDTVGTLLCEDFQCSTNVRRLPTLAYLGFDREAARQQRIEELRERSAAFAARVAE